jgi:hypothetical protein
MVTASPTGAFRTLPHTRLGWWGFGLLGGGAALQLVQSALVWATSEWAWDAAVRIPVIVFVAVMVGGVVLSTVAVVLRRDHSIMMIALALVTLVSLGGAAARGLAG